LFIRSSFTSDFQIQKFPFVFNNGRPESLFCWQKSIRR
jgi:hypothetical protein